MCVFHFFLLLFVYCSFPLPLAPSPSPSLSLSLIAHTNYLHRYLPPSLPATLPPPPFNPPSPHTPTPSPSPSPSLLYVPLFTSLVAVCSLLSVSCPRTRAALMDVDTTRMRRSTLTMTEDIIKRCQSCGGLGWREGQWERGGRRGERREG